MNDPSETSGTASTEANTAQSTTASKQEEPTDEIKALAKKRIQDDIDLALWYVEQDLNNGSSVCFPFEPAATEYSKLNSTQKQLYDEMLPKIPSLIPFEYTAEEYGYDVLDNVFIAATAICADYPEYELYFNIVEVFDNNTTTVALRSTYFFPSDPNYKNVEDTSALKEELEIFDAECNLIVEAIPENFSTYDKYRYLAAVITIRTIYDYSFTGGPKTMSAYGAIEGSVAICQGYSRAFEYLCRKANLWCKIVIGISQNTAHAWNLVKLESGTYHVDVTWSDADMNATLDEGWHEYFMLTQEQILSKDHEITDGTVATGTLLQ
ncbi:MAG: transglutaminase domain-containing protein [Firmicutes bacterium]|nr:transglutaminase domain-containing protein [Bacillota bacterium]